MEVCSGVWWCLEACGGGVVGCGGGVVVCQSVCERWEGVWGRVSVCVARMNV